MLIDFLDKLMGGVSRKWLIGRRFVIDLSEAQERRLAVVELPPGNFGFDLVTDAEFTRLVMTVDGETKTLGTFVDAAAARKCAKRIRWAIVRPLKKIFWTFFGVFFVMLTFDLLTTPKSVRVGQAPSTSRLSAGALTPEQMSSLARQSGSAGVQVAPSLEADASSSPAAQAAIRLLGGK